MMKLCPLLLVMILCASFAGCAGKQPQENHQLPEPDPAISRLNETVDAVKGDLQKLTRIKQANHETAEIQEAPEDGPLAKEITLKWSGPIRQAIKTIAEDIGYSFEVEGPSPDNGPILVTVDQVGEKAFNVLQEIGWKSSVVHVSVDADKKIIRLTYAGEENA